jgi:hypothetical protein
MVRDRRREQAAKGKAGPVGFCTGCANSARAGPQPAGNRRGDSLPAWQVLSRHTLKCTGEAIETINVASRIAIGNRYALTDFADGK